MALGIYMIDLADSCFEGVKIRDKDDKLFQRTTDMGKMNTGNNRQMNECVY